MEHLIADIIFVALGLVIVLICAKRGFLKNLIRSFRLVIAVVVTYFLGGHVASFLCNGFIGNMVRNFMYPNVKNIYDQTAGSLDSAKAIEELPAFLRTPELEAKLNTFVGQKDTWVDSVTDTLSAPIASLISNIIGYVLVFVLALIGLFFLVKLLDSVIEKVKMLDRINTILGAVWGFVLAFMILFMVSSLMKLFFSHLPIYSDSVIIRFFGDSALLQFLKIFDIGSMLLNNLLG